MFQKFIYFPSFSKKLADADCCVQSSKEPILDVALVEASDSGIIADEFIDSDCSQNCIKTDVQSPVTESEMIDLSHCDPNLDDVVDIRIESDASYDTDTSIIVVDDEPDETSHKRPTFPNPSKSMFNFNPEKILATQPSIVDISDSKSVPIKKLSIDKIDVSKNIVKSQSGNIVDSTKSVKTKKTNKKTDKKIKHNPIRRIKSKLTLNNLTEKVMRSVATQTDPIFDNSSRNTVIRRIVTVKNIQHLPQSQDNQTPLNLSQHDESQHKSIIIFKYNPLAQSSQPSTSYNYHPIVTCKSNATYFQHSQVSTNSTNYSNTAHLKPVKIPIIQNPVRNLSPHAQNLLYPWKTPVQSYNNPPPPPSTPSTTVLSPKTPPLINYQQPVKHPKIIPYHLPSSTIVQPLQTFQMQSYENYVAPVVLNLSKPKKNNDSSNIFPPRKASTSGIQSNTYHSIHPNPVSCDALDKYDMWFNYVAHSDFPVSNCGLDDLDSIPQEKLFDSGNIDISAYLQ